MLSATTGRVAWITGRDRSESTCSPCQSMSPPLARFTISRRRLPVTTNLRRTKSTGSVAPGHAAGLRNHPVTNRSRGGAWRQDEDMDVESGWDLPPGLDEFVLARIAEDKRLAADAAAGRGGGERRAADAAAASGRENWSAGDVGLDGWRGTAEHIARYDPARIMAECAAKRR